MRVAEEEAEEIIEGETERMGKEGLVTEGERREGR
jgi:hypothetical protein